ncbi:MAG: mechanosensitive ion channel [Cyanosarcina radialis HA8281-LM2]|jgi:hypothetical protein|nr:mechanosensitive ion channel [Cyanosarcina radialis HA8281-LM2]
MIAQNFPETVPRSLVLAQTTSLFGFQIDLSVANLIYAILILLVGWIVALIAANITSSLLKRTRLDNQIGNWITGRSGSTELPPVEKLASGLVFWVVMLLTLVAIFDLLKLTLVSQPLNNLLTQVLGFLPKLAGALILGGVAWLVATVVKLLVTRGLQTVRFDERLNQQGGEPSGPGQLSLSETIANALYWFVFLLFLPPILDALELRQALGPINNLVGQILGALPNILNAVLIGVVGWFVAQVVRRVVTNLLAAVGVDRAGTRLGISQETGGQNLSALLGTIVYASILIPTAIAALDALRIETISAPARSMLARILETIPLVLTAALILAIAFFVGRFVSNLLTEILTGLGFNNILSWLGLPTPRRAATPPAGRPVPPPPPPRPRTAPEPSPWEEPTVIQTPETSTVLQTSPVTTRTPSEIAGIVVLVAIMLFATVAATNVLQIPALTNLITGIVVVLGRVLGGLVVFAIGLYLANLAFSLIVSSGTRQSRILAQTARIAIIAFVLAMALQQMGIASNIVNLAFGLLLGSIAVAIALAFGLGSRDIAAEQLREWLASFKDNTPPSGQIPREK